MISDTFEDAFPPEWVARDITNPAHPLVPLRRIIPWEAIVALLAPLCDEAGRLGKPLRVMVALLIVSRLRGLGDREVVGQVTENRLIQHFRNVPDEGLRTFPHPSSLSVFRRRLGEAGLAITEEEVFGMLLRAGVISGDDALTDSTVLESDIIHPNDVRLIHKAFRRMRAFARLHGVPVWWDDGELAGLWRQFGLDRGAGTGPRGWSSSTSSSSPPWKVSGRGSDRWGPRRGRGPRPAGCPPPPTFWRIRPCRGLPGSGT